MAIEPTTCSTCGGDGWENGELCSSCGGQGSLPARGISALIILKLNDLDAKIDDIQDKCDDIFEQVSE